MNAILTKPAAQPEGQTLPGGSLVLITGATGGLGKAFAVECASRGWNLFLTDLRPEALESLAGGLRRTYGVQVESFPADLTDPASREALFTTLQTSRRQFWMLINVAGTDFEGFFYERSRLQVRTIVRLNIEGTVEMTRALLEHRDPLATFRIINVASLAAFYPMPVKATYAASKRFLLDFSLALNEELHHLGVTVTALCPAGMPTNPETIEGIEAQGLAGLLTTQNTGSVVVQTLDAALQGKPVCIPGALNRALQVLGGLLPPRWIAALVNRRWQAARRKRFDSTPAVMISQDCARIGQHASFGV